MTQDTSRKTFLTKVLGLATVGALASRGVAKALVKGPVDKEASKTAAYTLKPQARAVARRDGAA